MNRRTTPPRTHPKQPRSVVRFSRKGDGNALLTLVNALADFEKLRRPSRAARARLMKDGFGKRKRFDSLLALVKGKPVGYAILFESYSSFLARPTLYLEDIFVLPEWRGRRIGLQLFRRVLAEARRRKCGRMEWMVLDWNKNAIDFYRRIGAKYMKAWHLYRLVLT